MRPVHLAALVVLAAIWGGSFVLIRLGVPDFGPTPLMELRVALAAAALGAGAVARRRRARFHWRRREYALLGLVNAAAPFTLIAWSEIHLTGSVAAILNATTPLFGALVAARWGHEPLTGPRLAGLGLGICGVAVLVGWSPVPLSPLVLLSVAASLLAALLYAGASVYAARVVPGHSALALSLGQQLWAAIWLLPLAVALHPGHAPSPGAVAAVAALGVVCTAVAYLIFFPLLAATGPTTALSVTFLVPFFGVLWGGLFLHEAVGRGTVPGLLLIVASVLCVGGTRRRGVTPAVGHHPA